MNDLTIRDALRTRSTDREEAEIDELDRAEHAFAMELRRCCPSRVQGRAGLRSGDGGSLNPWQPRRSAAVEEARRRGFSFVQHS